MGLIITGDPEDGDLFIVAGLVGATLIALLTIGLLGRMKYQGSKEGAVQPSPKRVPRRPGGWKRGVACVLAFTAVGALAAFLLDLPLLVGVAVGILLTGATGSFPLRRYLWRL